MNSIHGLGAGCAQTSARPGITAVFRHDLGGGQLLALLSDANVAAQIIRALTAVAERDESFCARAYPLDDLDVVRTVCAAVAIDVPHAVETALALTPRPRTDPTVRPRATPGRRPDITHPTEGTTLA